ncbi:MAG: hypothetical protein K0U64_03590 [Actinomycetia bacterium]|nr:hypothetical protein [Actinomycetes bacterium]
MKIRLLFAGAAVVGLGLAGCSSSDSDSSASPSTSASGVNAQACEALDGISSQIEALGANDGTMTTSEAMTAIAQVETGFEEVQSTASGLSEKTADEMSTALTQYTTDIGALSSDAPVSDAASASPSPSPAFTDTQDALVEAYVKVQAELEC